MTPGQATVLGVLASILGSLGVAYIANRATVRASRTAADAGAFERAKNIYEGAIGTLQRELADLRSTAAAKHTELAEEVVRLGHSLAAQGKSLRQYEGRVIQLQEVLRAHGIPVPPWNGTALDGSPVEDPQPGPDVEPYLAGD